MNCDSCGTGNAVVHLTQVESDEAKIVHLCEQCAADKGLQPPESISELPLAGFLAEIGQEESGGAISDHSEKCDFCGLAFEGFRESGRLGCPHCYVTFETHLRGLLRRVHGATQHVGKVYLPPDPAEGDRTHRLSTLRNRLDQAIGSENFERAAVLRDEIRTLEAVG